MSDARTAVPRPETVAARAVRLMASFGFSPSTTMNPDYIEFKKAYADENGRVAQVIAQFVRPVAPHSILAGSAAAPKHGEVQLRGFCVTVQAQITADVDAVTERAPPVMQDDLLALVDIFTDENATHTTGVSIVTQQCGICGQHTNEFLIQHGIIRCRSHLEG